MINSSVSKKSVASVHRSKVSPKWGGNIIVTDPDYKFTDPFIFAVHHVHSFKAGEVAGFPAHPHRGFETITYVLEGGFNHGDSRGNKGSYGNGDVQWMTAGSGVLHSEMFITDKDKPTHFDGFQIWLNLPAKLKMSEPTYQMLWKNDVPVVDIRDEATNKNVNIKIIAGKVGDKQAKIEKSVPLSFLHVKIDPNHEWNFNIPKEHNNFLYIIKGEAIFDDTKVSNQSYVLMGHDSDTFSVKSGNEGVEFLLFEGQPYNEPFAHRGPFVMNTQQELQQAWTDFYSGKFGELEDDY
jgi:hypothetical protein